VDAPRGVLRVSSDGDDRMGAKIKTQKIPNKIQKKPWSKNYPQKFHAEFPSLNNFQKGLNDITRKKILEIECLCLFIFIIPADFVFSSSGSHSNKTRDTQESPLKSSHPKIHLPNFPNQKNPEIENFQPKKILRSSPSLEIRSTPLPPGCCVPVLHSGEVKKINEHNAVV